MTNRETPEGSKGRRSIFDEPYDAPDWAKSHRFEPRLPENARGASTAEPVEAFIARNLREVRNRTR